MYTGVSPPSELESKTSRPACVCATDIADGVGADCVTKRYSGSGATAYGWGSLPLVSTQALVGPLLLLPTASLCLGCCYVNGVTQAVHHRHMSGCSTQSRAEGLNICWSNLSRVSCMVCASMPTAILPSSFFKRISAI